MGKNRNEDILSGSMDFWQLSVTSTFAWGTESAVAMISGGIISHLQLESYAW